MHFNGQGLASTVAILFQSVLRGRQYILYSPSIKLRMYDVRPGFVDRTLKHSSPRPGIVRNDCQAARARMIKQQPGLFTPSKHPRNHEAPLHPRTRFTIVHPFTRFLRETRHHRFLCPPSNYPVGRPFLNSNFHPSSINYAVSLVLYRVEVFAVSSNSTISSLKFSGYLCIGAKLSYQLLVSTGNKNTRKCVSQFRIDFADTETLEDRLRTGRRRERIPVT